MTQSLPVKHGIGILCVHKFWKRVAGMFERIRSKRQQGLDLTGDLHPTAHAVAKASPPSLGHKGHLDGIQQRQLGQMREQAVFSIDPVNDASEFPNGTRGSPPLRGEYRRKSLEARRRERLALQPLQDARKKKESFGVTRDAMNYRVRPLLEGAPKDRIDCQQNQGDPIRSVGKVIENRRSGTHCKNSSNKSPQRSEQNA